MQPKELWDAVQCSEDKPFFIKYTPENTIRPKWFLVKADMDSTAAEKCHPQVTGNYYCVFYCRHPRNSALSDERSWLWPEWYRFEYNTRNPDKIIYGDQILIRPNVITDASKFIQWASIINLLSHSHHLLRPFNFQTISQMKTTRNVIDVTVWQQLVLVCKEHGLKEPTLGSAQSNALKKRNLPRKNRGRAKIYYILTGGISIYV